MKLLHRKGLFLTFLFLIVFCIGWYPASAGSTVWKQGDEIYKILSDIVGGSNCDIARSNKRLNRSNGSCMRTIVSIHIKDEGQIGPLRNRRTIRWGSGVLIAKNLILTNNHVLSDRQALDRTLVFANHFAQTADGAQELVKKLMTNSDIERLFFTDPNADFTIFEIDPVENLPIAVGKRQVDSYDLSTTALISSPAGQHVIYDFVDDAPKVEGRMIFHRQHSFPGSSGGGLFDKNGSFMGIHRASELDVTDQSLAIYQEAISFPFILDYLRGKEDSKRSAKLSTRTERLKEALEAAKLEWSIDSWVLSLPPGHETLTREAIHKSNVSFLKDRSMRRAITNGNIDVDYPTYWGALPKLWTLYRSHYGSDQYFHAMLTKEEYEMSGGDSEKAAALQMKLLRFFEQQVGKFISLDKIDRQQGARELGRIIHTVQDSYSKAHTDRTEFGIEKFHYYGSSDKDQHNELDLVKDKDGDFVPEAIQAIDSTVRVLEAAYLPPLETRQPRLLKALREVFRLDSKQADRGGAIEGISASPISVEETMQSISMAVPESAVLSEGTLSIFNQESRAQNDLFPDEIFRPIGDRCCPPIGIGQ